LAALIRLAPIAAMVLVGSIARAESPAPATLDRAHAEVLPFAYALMQEGDDYRAIGELKRFSFMAPPSEERFSALLAIGRAYELGGKGEDAARWLLRLEPLAITPQRAATLAVEQGYAHLLSGDTGAAIASLDLVLHDPALGSALTRPQTARARYLLAWSYLFHGQSAEAARAFARVDLPESKDLAAAARHYQHLPTKSPALAGALSAVVPGLGHLYLGMPGIALAAFAWNALFGVATYDAFHHRLFGVGAVLAGLELLWYGGSVFGAVSGAEKYNRDAQLNDLDALKKRYDVAPVSWPPELPR